MDPKQSDIELEASLLKVMSRKEEYERFSKVLDRKRLIPLTKDLLDDYDKWYEKHNSDIDWDVFITEFTQNWHSRDMEPELIAYYHKTVFPTIINAEHKDNLLIALLEREASQKVIELATKGDLVGAEETLLSLKDNTNMYQKGSDEEIFKLGSVDLSKLSDDNGIEWFLPSLQAGLGSLMPGHFIVVSADSGAGKSAFCVSQAVHVLRNIHKQSNPRPIIYCTSEDTKEDLAGRLLSNLYKDKCIGGFEEVVTKFDKVSTNFNSTYGDDLFIGMPIRNHSDLYKLRQKIKMYDPCLVVIDMIDILSESIDISSFTKLYNSLRGLANDGYAIIGTSQAGNTSYQDRETGQYKHRKWLTEKDLAGSKGGGKQGAAYAMLMIGQDDDMPGIRYITTTKKKRGHSVRVTCRLNEKYSLYEELL